MATLDTWDDLRAWIVSTYHVVSDEVHAPLLTFRAPDSEVNIGLRKLDTQPSVWVLLCAKLGATGRLSSFPALDSSFDIPIGFFFEHRGALGVGQKLPLRGLSSDTVDEVVRELIEIAGEVRQQFTADDVPDDDAFGHLAD